MAHGRGVWDEGVQAILRSFLNAVRLFLCLMYLSPNAILATKNHTARRQRMPSLEPVPRQRSGNVRVETFGTLEQGVDTLDFNENYVPSFVPPPLVRAREIQSMYWTQ